MRSPTPRPGSTSTPPDCSRRARRSEPHTRTAPVGLLALLARFVVAGLRRYPELNARVEHDGDAVEIVQLPDVNLGFAAQTDRGLVVPVVQRTPTG